MVHHITSYDDSVKQAWDAFVPTTQAGTIMHSRRFLEYHGKRFEDESLCIWSDPGVRLKAAIPLARAPNTTDVVASHPGSTFGGMIANVIDPSERASILSAVAGTLLERGYRKLVYKTVPAIFGQQFDESDLRLLLRAGTVRRADLWSFIRVDRAYAFSAKRRASIKAAERKGVLLRQGQQEADWVAFHTLLCSNLQERHSTVPVHSLAEMLDLRRRLEGENQLWLAYGPDGEILAGTWCFAYNAETLHTQYIASNPRGRELGAVDYLLAGVIDATAASSFKVMSFGINTLSDGYAINTNLLKQKLRFGSGVAVHWHFDVDLEQLAKADAGFS
ncbi:GNAT family N-acetyltransferase [Ensifer canadensis]